MVDVLLRSLGQRIRELRVQRGWSQEGFADVCGVHRTYVGHLERGEKNVSFGTLVRVSGALSVTLAELLAGLEERSGASGKQSEGGKIQKGAGRSARRNVTSLLEELRLQRDALESAVLALQEKRTKSKRTTKRVGR